VPLHQSRVQLETHDEHEQHQPDAGEQRQERSLVHGEEPLTDGVAEKRRTEQDAGRDLAHDGGLADLGEQPARGSSDDDDHH
jgi:hypothetical protein